LHAQTLVKKGEGRLVALTKESFRTSATRYGSSSPSPGRDPVYACNQHGSIPFPGAALLVVPSTADEENSGSEGSRPGSPEQPRSSVSIPGNGQRSNNSAAQLAWSNGLATARNLSPVIRHTIPVSDPRPTTTGQMTPTISRPVAQYAAPPRPTFMGSSAHLSRFRNTNAVLPGGRVPPGEVVLARIPFPRGFLNSPISRYRPS
jgi:hypothetical protein